MINFVEAYMTDKNAEPEEQWDEQRILIKAVSQALPLIVKNELTQKQSLCLRLFYIHNKSQVEIARELKLSQPTVSRHIKSAREITNRFLNYCYYSVSKANEQWLKRD